MQNIKWGIIGAGDVCEHKSGPAFYKIEHSTLVAVMRRDEAKIKDFATRHHVDRYYTDAMSLINDPDVNAIYIATPPDTHKEYTVKALEAGKPVYVEKPMALNYQECLDMIDVANRSGQKLFTAYYRRALPYFLKVKELLDAGFIGKVMTVDVKYIRPASEEDKDVNTQPWRVKRDIAGDGYFFDMAPHTLDILDFLLGEIEDATGYARNLAGYYTVSDTVSAVMQFKSGVVGTGLWNFASPKEMMQDTVTIIGTEGCLKFNTFSFQSIALVTGSKVSYYETIQPEHIQQPLIQTIVDELRGVGECPSNGVSGARTSRIMDLITNNRVG